MKTKFISFILAVLPLSFLNANEVVINNLTPESIPQNPSEIYSINVEVLSMSSNVNKDHIKPFVIIDGKAHPMNKGSMGPNSFTYDYKMPAGANIARYYFEVEYISKVFEGVKDRTIKSNLYDLKIGNRCASTLDINRGPVGATIPVSGRGLSNGDTITFGDIEVPTTYLSPNVITFKVPALQAERVYDVFLQGNNGSIPMGEFRIDSSSISADRDEVYLKSGERTTLTLEIDCPAPKGGIEFDITTDIPDSIIMSDVIVPEGSKTINVTIQGGKAGTGSIFVGAEGFDELEIPTTISEDEGNFWSN